MGGDGRCLPLTGIRCSAATAFGPVSDTLARVRLGVVIVALLAAVACGNTQQAGYSNVPLCDGPNASRVICMGCAVPAARWTDSGPLSCPRSLTDYLLADGADRVDNGSELPSLRLAQRDRL